jgi:hypothetical protein
MRRVTFASITLALLLSACFDIADTPAVSVETVPPGLLCPHGGARIVIDDAADEIVCNGADGAATLVEVTPLAPGDDCPHGGVRIDTGVDDGGESSASNAELDAGAATSIDETTLSDLLDSLESQNPLAGDGVLDEVEIDATRYVCNGAPGASGDAGPPGEVGARGPAGEAGVDGLDGLNGERGPSGEAGADGIDGEDGTDGIDGEDGENGKDGSAGQDGLDGTSTLIVQSEEPPGPECPAGGTRIDSGFDDGEGQETASDGILGPGEVDDVSYICHAVPTLALFEIEPLPPGPECPAGGQLLATGYDNGDGAETAGDGVLGIGEVDAVDYVCNGRNGAKGATGADGFDSLIDIDDELPGENCENGGQAVLTGLDDGDGEGTAHDGVLDVDEVDSLRYVCNGVDGEDAFDALVEVQPEAPGFNCAWGGQHLLTGRDDGDGDGAERDGVLHIDEVEHDEYVCNGGDGDDGADGSNALVEASVIDPGGLCAAGGLQIDIGLDDGDGAGTAGDGTLHVDEIDSTQTLCNGEDGEDAEARVIQRTSFAGADFCPGTQAGRSLAFDKASATSEVHVSYYDSFGVVATAAVSTTATWEVLFDGESCTTPGPLTHTLHFPAAVGFHTQPATIEGACSATASGALGIGLVTISVTASAAPDLCVTGFELDSGSLVAEEIEP